MRQARIDLATALRRAAEHCRARGANNADAEDAVQQAVLEALEAGLPLEPETTLAGWLTVVAHRRYVDRVRRAVRESRISSSDEHDRTARGPDEVVADATEAAYVVASLRALPERTRAVVASIGRGADIPSTATELGLSVRAVESHLTRARRFVRGAYVLD